MTPVIAENAYDSTSNRLSFLSKESNTSFNCKKQNYQIGDCLDIIKWYIYNHREHNPKNCPAKTSSVLLGEVVMTLIEKPSMKPRPPNWIPDNYPSIKEVANVILKIELL